MSNLEHIIENTLCLLEKNPGMDSDKLKYYILTDVNYNRVGLTLDEIYEICNYIYYTYLPSMMDIDRP